jgi:hypothetical protein
MRAATVATFAVASAGGLNLHLCPALIQMDQRVPLGRTRGAFHCLRTPDGLPPNRPAPAPNQARKLVQKQRLIGLGPVSTARGLRAPCEDQWTRDWCALRSTQ